MRVDHHHPVNKILDRLARPQLAVFKRRHSSYTICGCAGIGLAVLLNAGLSVRLDLSFWVVAVLTVNALLTLYTLAMTIRIIAGEETLTYYHHEIAIIITSGLVLWLIDQPVLLYLDNTILGVGVFLACGRIGCLMVGCCHGGPHRWGISYSRKHADAGFENRLVGVRLFPVQALEAAWVSAVVLGGSFFVLKGYPPGEALAVYTMAYGAGRFCFEFVRGDSKRPYFMGFSEAQWTSLVLMMLTMGAEVSGFLTFHAWHLVLTVAVACFMVALILIRRIRGQDGQPLFRPGHVQELAAIIDRVSALKGVENQEKNPDVSVGCTSAGVRISTGRIPGSTEHIRHYALSLRNGSLTEKTARRLGTLIQLLRHPADSLEIMKGKRKIYHLLFHVKE